MKNVLFVHSSSELYGSDRSLLNIVKNIDKNIYRVYVILPCLGPLVDEMAKIIGIDVHIFEVAVLRRKNLSFKGGLEYIKEFNSSIRFLKKFIKENKIGIVDTNTAVVFPGAIAAKKCKIKSVWHIREIIKSNLENKVISFIMDHYADLIVANSMATGTALKVNQDKVKVVYNAVENNNVENVIAHDNIIVGMAGRINRWKGQKLFVDVAEIVHNEFPEVKFKIAGEAFTGEEYLKQELIEYINQKELTDTVLLLGQVNNMSSFYSELDLFVLPSTQPEPFGLVVIEAMEYGIPVIATNHGGPTEIIDNGVDGFLVSYENAEKMANVILELIKNSEKRQLMGELARIKKENKFSMNAMITGIEKVFLEVLQ